MTLPTPSRRSVIKAGAWSAPAIVLAAGAPAFAVSGGRTITLDSGGTAMVNQGSWSVDFDGFTITPDSAIAAGGLSMTVTNPGAGRAVWVDSTPSGWASAQPNWDIAVYTYAGAIAAGQTIAIPDGRYFDDDWGGSNSFVLTFAAPDHDPAPIIFVPTP